MKKNIADILKKINFPFNNLNLFQEEQLKEIKPFLEDLNIANIDDLINQTSIKTSIQKLKSCQFKNSNHNFKIIEIDKKEMKNLHISYSYYQTKIGIVLVASTQIGICYLAFETIEKPALPFLKQIYPEAKYSDKAEEMHQSILNYIEGFEDLEITFHIKGTPFQIDVWKALLEIPKGSLTSYGEIAKKINKPKAFRAVGTAIGNNPISLLIPCHRVIQTNGKYGGYMWGLPTKFLLIAWEDSNNLK